MTIYFGRQYKKCIYIICPYNGSSPTVSSVFINIILANDVRFMCRLNYEKLNARLISNIMYFCVYELTELWLGYRVTES